MKRPGLASLLEWSAFRKRGRPQRRLFRSAPVALRPAAPQTGGPSTRRTHHVDRVRRPALRGHPRRSGHSVRVRGPVRWPPPRGAAPAALLRRAVRGPRGARRSRTIDFQRRDPRRGSDARRRRRVLVPGLSPPPRAALARAAPDGGDPVPRRRLGATRRAWRNDARKRRIPRALPARVPPPPSGLRHLAAREGVPDDLRVLADAVHAGGVAVTVSPATRPRLSARPGRACAQR